MAGRFGLMAFAILALALAVTSANRAILSVQGGAQYDLGDVQEMHRRLMTDLKLAQEEAGIFVDDTHLFERPLTSNGRRLQQTDVGTVISNPNILASMMTLLSQGLTVGSFPGAALNLPGGSPFGYAPTDDTYCLFATKPYTAPPPTVLQPGSPASSQGLPGSFACVKVDATGATGVNSFLVSYGGAQYLCTSTSAPTPVGRRLQQAPSPTDAAIGNALAAIGIPIWNCVVATTPAGNTTLGQATTAILNDLGVIAEHLLVYLNANGQLTYQQNVVNNFVSLTNPLYPTGPRLNFSIDFATVAKDVPLLEEIFRQPAPPTPSVITTPTSGPPAGSTGSTTTGDSTLSGGTSGGSSSQGGAGTGSTGSGGSTTGSQGGSSSGGGATTTTTIQTPQGAVNVTVPAAAPVPVTVTRLVAFDGYLDNCQTVIGSAPHADGNFDRTNNFSAVISDGVANISIDTTAQYAGQVWYIIPASKAVQYTPLTLATRKTAQFCYDVATLQPTYNPLASFIVANATNIIASPSTTVAAFGQAYGLTPDALTQALGISLPSGQTLGSYDALSAANNGDSQGLALLKINVLIANVVSAGANLLTNDTTTYASYAIILDQSIAKKVLYSPPTTGRKLLQTSAPAASAAPAAAVDLTNATTVASIISIAQQSVPTQPDETTRAALIKTLTPAQVVAVGTAIANLNLIVSQSTDASSTQLGQYYAQTQLAPQVNQLATGAITADQFTALTSPAAVSQALATQKLPGQIIPTPAAPLSPPVTALPSAQASSETESGKSGLSHGGTVALATILPIVGVIAIIAAVTYYISRKRSASIADSPNNSAVWWRRPFARSGGSASPIAGSSTSV